MCRIAYAWWVLVASIVILSLNAGARLMIGVLVKPIIAEFGWSRGTVSAAVFVNMVVLALAVLVTGRLYDRYGPKWVILVSSVVSSGGLMLMATMDSRWEFFLYYGVISGVGLGGTMSTLFAAVVSRWFAKYRGTVISLATTGNSLGQFALVPLFAAVLLDDGWRATMVLVGLVFLAVNVVLALTVIRGDPEDLGKEPYGRARSQGPGGALAAAAAPGAAAVSAGPAAPGYPELRSLGLREAMRTPSFWLFSVAMFVCGAGDFLLTTHLVPMATDHGVPTPTAVAMLAWFGLLSMGGILVAGPASDLVGNKPPIALAFALRIAVFLLVVWWQTATTFWVLSLVFGFTFLITAPLTTTLMGRLYGFGSIGVLSGFVICVHHVGGGLWAYLGGAVFDATGGYTLALAVSAGASALALVCTLLIRESRHVAPPRRIGLP